jgi:hypothetical protein
LVTAAALNLAKRSWLGIPGERCKDLGARPLFFPEKGQKMKSITRAGAALLAALIIASPATARGSNNSGDAQIPFVNEDGVFDWSAPNDNTLFVEGQDGEWYQATMMGACQGMSFANRIGFDTGGLDSFDRFSNVLVNGQRCPVQALTRLPGSPLSNKAGRTKHQA